MAATRNTRSKTPLVVAIVLVVAAIVAIAAVLATRGDDDDAAPAATGPVTTGEQPGSEPDTTDDATDDATATTNLLPEELIGEVRPVTVEGSALPQFENPNTDAAVGLSAPVLVGESFDGSAVSTASEGGPVMVVFFAHWCPHCNNEIPRMIGLDEDGRFPDDLKIVGVSTAVAADRPGFPPSEWIADMDWPWPVMADDFTKGTYAGAAAFGVNSFPFATVVGADGTVLGRWTGESEPDDLIAKLDAALAT